MSLIGEIRLYENCYDKNNYFTLAEIHSGNERFVMVNVGNISEFEDLNHEFIFETLTNIESRILYMNYSQLIDYSKLWCNEIGMTFFN